jgi:F0F1-type ATP synthase assembly protein I
MANSEEIQRGSAGKRRGSSGGSLAVWIVAGTALGLLLGAVFGNAGAGLVIGVTLGVVVGMLATARH